MNTNLSYLKARNDSGLLREYVVDRMGFLLVHGGNATRYFRALRFIKRISKMTGIPYEQVLDDIKQDYCNS